MPKSRSRAPRARVRRARPLLVAAGAVLMTTGVGCNFGPHGVVARPCGTDCSVSYPPYDLSLPSDDLKQSPDND